jgi:hypothetical protein
MQLARIKNYADHSLEFTMVNWIGIIYNKPNMVNLYPIAHYPAQKTAFHDSALHDIPRIPKTFITAIRAPPATPGLHNGKKTSLKTLQRLAPRL